MISRKTKYGLQALLHLARKDNNSPVLIADLAKDEGIPKKFLEAILLALKNADILASRKGKGGGYTLARSPQRITLFESITALEGSLAPLECLGETSGGRCSECEDPASCGIRLAMRSVYATLKGSLQAITLAGMLEMSELEKSKLTRVVDFAI